MESNSTMENITMSYVQSFSKFMVTTDHYSMTTANQTANNGSNYTAEEPRNAGKSIYDYPDYIMSLEMYPIHTFMFVIAGMIGNTLALSVILRKNMRNMSSSVFLGTLALADNLALLGFLLGMVSLSYTRHIVARGFCTVYFVVLSFGSMVSSWTIVAMSFERVLIVTFPLKAPNWTSRKKAVIVETVIIIALSLHHSQFFWTATTVESEGKLRCAYNENVYADLLGKWSIYDAIMSSYLPLFLILIMNLVIIFQIKKARNIQKSMSNAQGSDKKPDNQGKRSANSTNATNQITVMLLSVSLVFFLCMCPYGVFQIYTNYIVDGPKISKSQYARIALSNQFLFILWETNHSINVVLYCLTGRKFRNEMLSLLTCGKYQGSRPRSSTYASDATRTTNMKATNGATSMTSVNTVSAVI